MRILLTGGAGCLGLAMMEHFIGKGHKVLILDNFATGHRAALPEIKNLEVVEGSIGDADLVHLIFKDFKPTHVINAAASYKNPDDWQEDVNTNVSGMIHLIRASQEAQIERFVNLQTALCYGAPQTIPIPVDHPCTPVSSYGITKNAGETYLHNSNLNWISIRLASVIGPRLSIGAIPTFYTRLKEGKSCFCTTAVRDFLDMTDYLSFIDMAVKSDSPQGLYNLGPGLGHTIKEVFEAVAKSLSLDPIPEIPVKEITSEDVETVILDSSKTEKDFGWKSHVSFEEMINKMVSWYDQHGVSAIYSHLAPAINKESNG